MTCGSHPRDEGFVVERVYEAVDDPADVTRDADGTWRIVAGAKVRVRLTMVADAQRTSVALVDPLPAGLEPLNPALAVSSTTPPEQGERRPDPVRLVVWGWNWFEHQNLATTGSRRSPATCRAARTSTPTSPGPPPPASSWCHPPRPRRCTPPRCSAASASARVVVE
jgi:alpha-2-macroglobulin